MVLTAEAVAAVSSTVKLFRAICTEHRRVGYAASRPRATPLDSSAAATGTPHSGRAQRAARRCEQLTKQTTTWALRRVSIGDRLFLAVFARWSRLDASRLPLPSRRPHPRRTLPFVCRCRREPERRGALCQLHQQPSSRTRRRFVGCLIRRRSAAFASPPPIVATETAALLLAGARRSR